MLLGGFLQYLSCTKILFWKPKVRNFGLIFRHLSSIDRRACGNQHCFFRLRIQDMQLFAKLTPWQQSICSLTLSNLTKKWSHTCYVNNPPEPTMLFILYVMHGPNMTLESLWLDSNQGNKNDVHLESNTGKRAGLYHWNFLAYQAWYDNTPL